MKAYLTACLVLLLFIVIIFYPSATKTERLIDNELQDWDVQENEVLKLMRDILHARRQIYIEEKGITESDYNPDDFYSYQTNFNASNSEYGIYRHWTCYAFYLNMPYTGWIIRVDSPTGKLLDLTPLTLSPPLYSYNHNDDLRAAQETIDEHRVCLLSCIENQSYNDKAKLLLDIENEFLGAWSQRIRIIPLNIYYPETSNTVNSGLYVLIRVIENYAFAQHYCWSIRIFFKEEIVEYDTSSFNSDIYPIFSNRYIVEEQKEILFDP